MHFSIYLEFIAAVVIVVPTVWELWNDRNGESKEDKVKGIKYRAIIWSICIMAALCVRHWPIMFQRSHSGFESGFMVLQAFALMFAVHLLVFDYAIVVILKKNGVIRPDANPFTYLGKTANYPKWWVSIGAWGRFAIRLIVFAVALIWYF